MNFIRLISDVHLEADVELWHRGSLKKSVATDMDLLWYPTPVTGDEEATLVLAGDIWPRRRYLTRKHPVTGKSWLETVAARFKYVVFVLGNHDYWGQNLHFAPDRVRLELTTLGLTNVFFLERDAVVLDQVKFIGGTLWTDFDNANPLKMVQAQGKMNDYAYVRATNAYRSVHPADLLGLHAMTRDFIFANAVRDNPDQTVVVVTHHAPSERSFSWSDTSYVAYYASRLDERLHDPVVEVDYWFHGHIHSASRYNVDRTTVICNPRGYFGQECAGYQEDLMILPNPEGTVG